MNRFYFTLVAVALMLTGCKSTYENSSNASTTRNPGLFTKIEASMVNVNVIIDNRNDDMTINAPDKLLPYLHISNDAGKLKIWIDDNRPRSLANINNKIEITVHTSSLLSAEASVASNITVTGTIIADEFDGEASTGSKLSIASLQCKKLEIYATTGSSVNIASLSAHKAEIEASTGASVNISQGSIEFARLCGSTGASVNTHSTIINSGDSDSSTGASIRANFAR